MKVFALYDKVAQKFVSTTLCENEELFVRTSLFAVCMDYAINDVDFYCVGLFDDDTGVIKPCIPRKCDWECYKFPVTRQSKEKFLSITDIEKSAHEKKHEFIKKQKDSVKDLEQYKTLLENKLQENLNYKDKKEIKKAIEQIELEIKRLQEVA